MLDSLAIVKEVEIWHSPAQVSTLPPERGLDILILGFGDFDIEVADKIAQETWLRGGKVLLLLNQEEESNLDVVTSVPSNGFLQLDQLTSDSLVMTIKSIADGGTPMPGMLANRLLTRAREGALESPSPTPNLTPRERQVLELLVEGLSNKQIARRLHISQHGVKRLVSNILAKLCCPNRTLAVAVAINEGILVED